MNNSMVMMEEVRKPDVPSTLEAQLGSIAEGYNSWRVFAKASRIWYNTYWD